MKHIIQAGLIAFACTILAGCGGGGGGSSSADTSVTVTPIAVQASSYLNAKNVGATPITLPAVGLGIPVAYALADFFQDGSLSLVVAYQKYCFSGGCDTNQTAATSAATASAGVVKFYRKINGSWVDSTSSILSDTTGCIHPRKAAVADFNGDGKPDVIFACHGYDASPYPGENARILLSGSTGYTNKQLAISGYLHGVTAFDPSGSGYANVVFTGVGSTTGGGLPAYFTNNHDGTFTQTSLIDTSAMTSVYTVEALDINSDGKYDILFSGHETSGGQTSAIYYGTTAGTWSAASAYSIPLANSDYGFILDVVYTNGKLNVLRTVDNSSNSLGFYGSVQLEQINLTTSAYTTPYTHTGSYSNGMTWFPWMTPSGGNIVSAESVYGMSVAQ